MSDNHILTIHSKEEEAFLRKKTSAFSFNDFSRKELRDLVQSMRSLMKEANGVGLSANQAGHSFRMFVVKYEDKFYAIFNPEIVKHSDEVETMEEGCLSIPGKYGLVERSLRVTLAGQNIEGRKVKIRARGFLAKIFQHETDHLNGVLFIDKAESVYEAPTSDRLNEKHHDA